MQRMGTRRRWAVVAAGAVLMAGLPLLRGQEPKPAPAKAEAPARQDLDQPAWAKLTEDSVKPLPLESIPDDPPPHEGALLEISHRLGPTDLILVEVLEASPGRPISGERLVQPNGMVSLNWYGDVHAAGLTEKQLKAKIVHHLRGHLADVALGLIVWDETGTSRDVAGGPRPADPFPSWPPEFPVGVDPGMPLLPRSTSLELDQKETPKKQDDRPDAARPNDRPAAKSKDTSKSEFLDPLVPKTALSPPFPGLPAVPGGEVEQGIRAVPGPVAKRHDPVEAGPNSGPGYMYVDPADTSRVFVMVTAYNSKTYFVQGDVGAPGRFPYNGNDTVFDAINLSGGFLHSADRHNIHLNRPARGGKPARTYRIDYNAIERGDTKANLQVFPGDRLIIERKEIFEPRA